MKNLLTIALLFISSLIYSQKTSKDLTAATNKDTLISVNKNDIDLLHKVMLSQNFYRSLYDLNDGKLNMFEEKIITLEDIIKRNENDIKKLEDNVSILEYDKQTAVELMNQEHARASQETISKLRWREFSLIGIPVSLAGGFLIATLIR